MATQSISSHAPQPAGQRRLLIGRAMTDAFRKLDPRWLVRNPVMFVVEIGALLTAVLWLQALLGAGEAPAGYIAAVALWLWFTLLFANFAEALAEGRGKAQAEALRRTRQDTPAKKLRQAQRGAQSDLVSSTVLRQGDVILAESGDIIAADGEVIEGIASVDESAVTGESAPVIRESGGDRSAVTGGTRLLSEWLVIRVTANPGEGFMDRMISLIEGAKRQKTPNEIALNILLAAFTIIFLVVCLTLLPFSLYSVQAAGRGAPVTVTVLVALLVCLIPTTIGGLLSAIGIAGMDRMIRHNVIAMSGRAVEAAGDVDVLLLDKTGTITLGNRQAVEFMPVRGIAAKDLAEAAQLASLADETPEGRSIVVLAKNEFGLRGRAVSGGSETHDSDLTFVPFTAQTRISGVNLNGVSIRKGAPDTMLALIQGAGNPTKLIEIVEIGKQLLMTRGALTTFSITNDVAKYFVIIPAAFASTYPALGALNFMQLATPQSAILSAVIFNALIIVALIPLALRGVPYRAESAAKLLRDNLLIYGLGGLVAPFVGIKLIDMVLVALNLA